MDTSGVRGPGAKRLGVAAAHSDLGLPVPRNTRFRLVKRVLGRMMWAFGRDQSLYNHAMVEAVGELLNTVETMRTAIPEHVGNEIGSMRSQVGSLEVDVRNARARLDDLHERVDELVRRLET